MTTEVARTSDVAIFPPAILLGLQAGESGSVAASVEHMRSVAPVFPAAAHELADDLARGALRLIARGQAADAGRLASDTLAVCAASGGRWAR